ncbi:dihydrofolate reductase family protein [Microbacterium sp. No. 7]|uniref:dihydrofolate reductase family protein n=1 Tax=Microbacterium sp. No. 7 TaxID=1714373 RepID=UPI0006D2BC48|nr:dihydrofolate reductase family protein [Microbacterium sp. No. 7]ALJ18737.1 riboflavin biosynthesis protein RibD [Microbacterium sp. No. 7]
MRELVYYIGVSIDGFIAAPDGTADAFPFEGDHVPLLTGEFADALPAHVLAAIGATPPRTRFDAVIMGWNTYAVAHDAGIDSPYAHLDQYVASRTRTTAPDAVTLTADPVATVRELKAHSGLGIYLCGGGELASVLADEIDRIIVKRYPVLFGGGIPMLRAEAYRPASFTLEQTRTFASGVTVQEYARRA